MTAGLLSLVVSIDAFLGTSFGTSLKGVHLHCRRETTVFSRNCTEDEAPCTMQHWWSGGTFEGYGATRVRYYVDGDEAVNMPLGLAHGMSTDDFQDNAPWAAGALFGKSGVGLHAGGPSHGSGFFNTFHVPFAKRINVTVAIGCPDGGSELILRGRTRAAITLPGGLALPTGARLHSFEAATELSPYAFLPLVHVNSSTQSGVSGGAVLMTTITVRSPPRSYEFLEGQVRTSPASSVWNRSAAGGDGSWALSSGTEDYFLGTFYFDKGQYFQDLAGLTALCPMPPGPAPPAIGCTPSEHVLFSAYRVHAGHDPLLFADEGMHLSWRNGEPGHGGAGATVNASVFALVYTW